MTIRKQPLGRVIVWGEDGLPRPEYREAISKDGLNALIPAAVSCEYEPLEEMIYDAQGKPTGEYQLIRGEERFIGMTKAEVAAHRYATAAAQGDMEAIKFIHDRVLGKPKQQTENLNLDLSMQDYLKIFREEDRAIEAAKTTIVDITPTPIKTSVRKADLINMDDM